MRKFVLMMMAVAAMATGCVSRPIGHSGYQELTPAEYRVLVVRARNLLINDNNTSPEQGDFLVANEPEIKLYYYDDIQGRMSLTWSMDKKIFRVTYIGVLNSRDTNELTVQTSIWRLDDPASYRGEELSSPQDIRNQLSTTKEYFREMRKR